MYSVVGDAGTLADIPVCENEKSTANTNSPTYPKPPKGPSRPADTTPSPGTPIPAETTPPIDKPDPADTTPPMTTTPPEILTDPPKETTPPPPDTTKQPVVTPAPDDPSVAPAATAPTKTDENPKTDVSLGIAGLAILSGVICAVSLSKGKQSGKKKKKNGNSKIDL